MSQKEKFLKALAAALLLRRAAALVVPRLRLEAAVVVELHRAVEVLEEETHRRMLRKFCVS